MKRQASLIALAVAAALVALLVWLDQRRPSTEEATRQRPHILPGFDRARATELDFERPALALRHEASGWWLVGPPRRRADDDGVEALLGVLEYGEIERRIPNADAALRDKLGLAQPRVILRVEGHTLRIGGDDPSRGVYVARDDERDVLVAERRLIETAGIDPRLWLSMRLTLTDANDARQIATNGWTLERAGGWRVTRPVKTRADGAKVDALVQSLVRTRATKLGERSGGDGGVTLALDGAPQATLGGRCSDEPLSLAAARADGATLCFHDSDFNLVRTPPEHYYERRLFPLRLDDLVAVDVGPLELRRESDAWRIVAPLDAARPVDDAKVRAFLEPLLAAEAHSFSTAPPSAASTAAARATRVRLATRDEEIVAAVNGSEATRAGETVTLELGAPLQLATSF